MSHTQTFHEFLNAVKHKKKTVTVNFHDKKKTNTMKVNGYRFPAFFKISPFKLNRRNKLITFETSEG